MISGLVDVIYKLQTPERNSPVYEPELMSNLEPCLSWLSVWTFA